MKAILKFNLPEEASDFYDAVNGHKAFLLIEELRDWLRGLIKYSDKHTISIEEVRTKIWDLIEENHIKDREW